LGQKDFVGAVGRGGVGLGIFSAWFCVLCLVVYFFKSYPAVNKEMFAFLKKYILHKVLCSSNNISGKQAANSIYNPIYALL